MDTFRKWNKAWANRALFVAFGVGLVGMVAIVSSRAATYVVTAEAENGIRNNVTTTSDPLASGGAAVAFGGNAAQCTKGGATGSSATRTITVGGATANDATDDRVAIQAALDAAASGGGGIVSLPTGTFIINYGLHVGSNVLFQGSGSQTVIKAGPSFMNQMGPNGSYPVISTDGSSNVTLANFTADQSGDTQTKQLDDGRLAAYLIDVRRTTNAVVRGVYTRNPLTYSITAVGSTKFCFHDNNTQVATSGKYNQLDGIHVLDSSFGDVVDNTIDQRVGTDGDDGLVAHSISGPTHDVRYANNKVRGGDHGNGMQIAVGNYPIYSLTITGNEFYDSPFGIRTGYYDNGTGAVHDIVISNNNIHDLRAGYAFPLGGDAINIGGFGANGPVTNITISNNRACNAGTVTVVPGLGNSVSGTTGC